MGLLTLVLLIAAGAALVAQNLIMVRITSTVSTVLIALVMNSGVGLLFLLILLIGRSGFSGFKEVVESFRIWNVIPGILGSFFVFASIIGYQRFGAAGAVSVIVSSQLIFGFISDILKGKFSDLSDCQPAIIGIGLLMVGAVLVAFRTS